MWIAGRSQARCRVLVLWTALSLALGIEVQGRIVKGLPCIKRRDQLFCSNAGNSYPQDNIESFIDNNKALTRRMYGDFQSELGLGEIVESAIRTFRRGKRSLGDPLTNHMHLHDMPLANHVVADDFPEDGEPIDQHSGFNSTGPHRTKRQTRQTRPNSRPSSVPAPPIRPPAGNRKDSCDSKMEIVTPYWASNSAGKILAIVNLNEFSQVIHQEVCTRSSTKRCNGDCACEQKYKWHRMLAYDLENECKGIFVDWFLFPSCCVCRCDP